MNEPFYLTKITQQKTKVPIKVQDIENVTVQAVQVYFIMGKRGNINWVPILIKHDLQQVFFGRLNELSGLLINFFGRIIF